MEATPAIEPTVVEQPPAAILRGTARGLEAVVDASAPLEAIAGAIEKRIDEAPAFFKGSDIRIRVEDGPLAMGSLAKLEELARKYELRIIEISAAKKRELDAIPQPSIAAGSAPAPVEVAPPVVVEAPPPAPAPAAPPIAVEALAPGARLFLGPVRSGVILEHTGHLIIFGDVNPGADVRAEGNIIVLGRLRGTAHAAIGKDAGFILALQLQPQQLRICRQVARAAEGDASSFITEIAYVSGGQIVVEKYTGKLPAGLATSI